MKLCGVRVIHSVIIAEHRLPPTLRVCNVSIAKQSGMHIMLLGRCSQATAACIQQENCKCLLVICNLKNALGLFVASIVPWCTYVLTGRPARIKYDCS